MTRSMLSKKQVPSLPSTTKPKNYELEYSFFFVIVLSGVYIAYELMAEPRGGHPFGHALGILGTILMVMTEGLYSVRKRTALLNWAGPVRHWLAFHIFTGIVGPFMVLMHTGLEFRGLAGISMFLTVMVVGSGFIGRYLYTAIPRTLSGVVTSRQQIEAEARALQMALARFEEERPVQVRQLIADLSHRAPRRNPLVTVFGRFYFQWRYRWQVRRALGKIEQMKEAQRRQLTQLLSRKRDLDRQVEMLEAARWLLRYWHILHVPIGLTLFFSVLIHVVATLYFRAGLFK